MFLTPPSLLTFSGHSLSISSDCVVGSEYLDREPSKLYPGCSGMHPYRTFPLGYQDAGPDAGVPLQQGFRHVSCSHYHGGLVSPFPHSLPGSSLSQLPLLLLCIFDPRRPLGVPILCQALSTVGRDTTLTSCSVHFWEGTHVDKSVPVQTRRPGLWHVRFRAVGQKALGAQAGRSTGTSQMSPGNNRSHTDRTTASLDSWNAGVRRALHFAGYQRGNITFLEPHSLGLSQEQL